MPPLRVVVAYVSVALVWGSTWAAIKIGVNDVPPFVFAFARALLVAILLTIIALASRQRFPRGARTIAVAVVVGLFNLGCAWAVIFWSEQFVPSGLVSVFGAASPVWTAVLAHFLVKGDRL
jgi:drug/metabolite transporter (DMT)-like permease